MSIQKGFYSIYSQGVYVTSEEFIWEYKYFYHGAADEIHLMATEYQTGTTISKPLVSVGNLNPEIEEILKTETERIRELTASSN
ncbi:hypothetical protein [Lysinibacillus xylanilyticus]|uniref:hypothetical protein n=1 Tax=Lysinibacillus xylanilyticus TaxID=582475 RepID=UPI003D07BA1E